MKSSLPRLAIVGFGSQAKAWALNLRDSGLEVTIFLKNNSPSKSLAVQMGFHVKNLDVQSQENHCDYKLVMLLIPDDQHISFFEKYATFFSDQTHFIYAHGFSLTKFELKKVFHQFHHSLLAPKAIASEVRFQFETKGKLGAAYSPAQPALENEIISLAHAVGIRALYLAQVEEETKADLFSEQSLLCSMLPYLSLHSYNILRKNGIGKEVAFMECFLELKSISKAFVSLGPEDFFKLISPNALIGSQKGKKLLLGTELQKNLEKIMADINDGTFYREVEIDADLVRQQVLKEWDKEELTKTFKELKKDLID
jgi:ketol-acid reductoisomerase